MQINSSSPGQQIALTDYETSHITNKKEGPYEKTFICCCFNYWFRRRCSRRYLNVLTNCGAGVASSHPFMRLSSLGGK